MKGITPTMRRALRALRPGSAYATAEEARVPRHTLEALVRHGLASRLMIHTALCREPGYALTERGDALARSIN